MKRSDGNGGPANPFELTVRQPERPGTAPPCQVACPNSGDIRAWIGLVAQHEKVGLSRESAIELAWEKIVDRNPFPATLGRICPHPCESGCNRSAKEGPVAINAMERFIGDWAIEHQFDFNRLEDQKPEKVAAIGAGPAGLSFAYQMARRGYSVTIFESRPEAGGMLRYGIPDYRMPPEILDAEIERIRRMGVEIRHGVQIDDRAMADIRQSFDIVFVAIGAQKSLLLGIPGEIGNGCWTGTDFLLRVNTGEAPELGAETVVIGGGNTAIDAARTAIRLGSKATIYYRRTRDQMPANAVEIEDALDEGVHIEFLAAPTEVVRNDVGDITGLRLQRMQLTDADASGRPRPVPIPDSSFTVPASSIVAAVAQVADADRLDIRSLEQNGLPSGHQILSGGDMIRAGIAGDAIIQGRKAAEAIHKDLYGVTTPEDLPGAVVQSDDLMLGFFPNVERANLPGSTPADRTQSLRLETHTTLNLEAFFREASRCMSCGACFGCSNCFMYCNADCYSLSETVTPGSYFMLDLSACEGCTKCIELCPSATIQ
jgi:formate dehydrogenase major subunit